MSRTLDMHIRSGRKSLERIGRGKLHATVVPPSFIFHWRPETKRSGMHRNNKTCWEYEGTKAPLLVWISGKRQPSSMILANIEPLLWGMNHSRADLGREVPWDWCSFHHPSWNPMRYGENPKRLSYPVRHRG